MDLEYAQNLAHHLIERIKPTLIRVEVAGSIRRECERVGDIEIVAQPYLNEDLFADQGSPILEPLLGELGKIGRIVKGGQRYIRVFFTKPEVYGDIFLVHPPAQWGSIMAIRTGPSDLSRYVVTKMREQGVRHQDGYAKNIETGEVVPTPTEEDFFGLAGLTCPLPKHRDALAKKVWE